MLAVFPAAHVFGGDQSRRLAKGRNASRSAPQCNRIDPDFDLSAHRIRPLARQLQWNLGSTTQS